jgi:hypothetical protein
MTDETMTVAGLVADLRDEVRRLTKERDKLRSALTSSHEAWQLLRDTLDIGPNESVMSAVDKLRTSRSRHDVSAGEDGAPVSAALEGRLDAALKAGDKADARVCLRCGKSAAFIMSRQVRDAEPCTDARPHQFQSVIIPTFRTIK